MTRIDQFESAFKAANKTVYRYAPITFKKVLMVTDLQEYEATLFSDRVRSFLSVLGDDIEWHVSKGDECASLGKLLELIEAQRPDLICTYRNLHSGGWRWPYSLGEHLDVLTQVTTTPVLVLPRPDEREHFMATTENTDSVLAVTNHLAGDDQLVNYAVRLTARHGTLRLTHIEDEEVFERYIDAISKISSIDTDPARKEILRQLLREPTDYITTCIEAVGREKLTLRVECDVTIGRYLDDYKRLIGEHKVDLLVLNTKDEDQLAMHGLAHPLAIELRHVALLLL